MKNENEKKNYNLSKFNKLPISFGISPDNPLYDKSLFISKNKNIWKIKIMTSTNENILQCL